MKRQHILVGAVIVLYLILLSGCASMRVKGEDPISRSISVTQLLIDGKTKDSYIEIYLDEIVQANSLIDVAIAETNYNSEAYLKIADSVDSWITLNNNLRILSERYPNGLDGKKLHANFKYTDYQSLKIQAKDYAADMYFEKAQNLYTNKQLTAQERRPAIEYLKKAATYSTKYDDDIPKMGADICYAIGIEESSSSNIATLEDAVNMFIQAEKWLPGYKDTQIQITTLNSKIANLYITKGDMYFKQNNYSSFRKALENYDKAKNHVRGTAENKITDTKKALTIKVAYFFGGNSYNYPDGDKIARLLQEELDSNTRGPAYLNIDFIHATNKFDLLFANFDDYDLLFIPDENYGDIQEVFGPAKSSQTDVTKTVENNIYSGSIVEQTQDVTIYRLNKYYLYDMRSNRRNLLHTWTWKQDETSKKFVNRQYFGVEEAKPFDFDKGETYEQGQYNEDFPELYTNPILYNLLTASYNSLNTNGEEFADILKNLEYR